MLHLVLPVFGCGVLKKFYFGGIVDWYYDDLSLDSAFYLCGANEFDMNLYGFECPPPSINYQNDTVFEECGGGNSRFYVQSNWGDWAPNVFRVGG